MNVYPVQLTKTESCLSYALKRIGKAGLLPIDYEGMLSGTVFEVLGGDLDNLDMVPGDIVVWDRDLQKTLLPIEIDEAGRIVHAYVRTGLHYAVYEGGDILSDCVRDGDYPVIRLRKLSDTRPDRVLRLRRTP